MKQFLSKDFLLEGKVSKKLYHKVAKNMPIFDFHNHLSAKEIYENKSLGNLCNAWLDHDHYKWRAMRAMGVSEDLITAHLNIDGSVKSIEERGGKETCDKNDYERYLAFVKTLQGCVANPLYHWSHLELQRYFGIKEPLSLENAKQVWDKCNCLLENKDYFPRSLLQKMGVHSLCTTDDPLDSLEYHKKLSLEWKDCRVLPSFRPDFALCAENKAFSSYISQLEKISGIKIASLHDMINAFENRMDYFREVGSVVSDHSLESDFYLHANYEQVNEIFSKAMKGEELTNEEKAKYKGYVLIELGKLYAKKGFVMQIHIGALRDQNASLLQKYGKNIGEDSLADFNYISQLGCVLNAIYSENENAKVIVYNLNPKDNEALATMAANFRNCIFGPAWWFCDNKEGIEQQIKVFARTSVLSKYVGMLTDSRSFLSYPRHEYFRRIICNFIGNLVEKGEFPYNEKLLFSMVENICYKNSVDFFSLK